MACPECRESNSAVRADGCLSIGGFEGQLTVADSKKWELEADCASAELHPTASTDVKLVPDEQPDPAEERASKEEEHPEENPAGI